MDPHFKDFAARRLHAYRMGRTRRGDIRIFLLWSLCERPMHGYELIRFFEEKTHGLWSPSAGSVYPTLQLLEEQGLVTGKNIGGKRVFTITKDGRKAAEEMPKGSFANDPKQADAITKLRETNFVVRGLMKKIITEGSVDDLKRAAATMNKARVELSKLLGHYPSH